MTTVVPEPRNRNYAAEVVEIKALLPLEGSDRIVGVPVFGMQAIVQKGLYEIGDRVLYFPAESQLSHEYAANNDLYRDGTLNKGGSTGFIENNRRVKAIRLRGHVSNALLMPLSSVEYTGVSVADWEPGETFDSLDGQEICRKYEVKSNAPTEKDRAKAKAKKAQSRVDAKFFPLHIDTDQWWRNEQNVLPETELIVTQKLHGTSVRIANTLVTRTPTLRDRIAKFFGVAVQDQEYAMVYGSRKVTKDANNPDHKHFYDADIWTEVGRTLDGWLPEGYQVFGEVVGWVGDSPIQKGYTYGVPKGEWRLYVYRVTHQNTRGDLVDLSWDQVREFCDERGLNHVPEFFRKPKRDFGVDSWLDDNYYETSRDLTRDEPVYLPTGTVDEGICLRVDGLSPYILKAKSPLFYEHETAMLDEQIIDIETEGGSNE